ncbi:MAG: DNA-deoxyinosine glycosylase [Gammaproteobacteria bacterium]|jgi:hypoxanthine-DNA glycosylase|nr:DNA-deoxyinosine glycosylase [Gammaproteobacteria bacterium]MBT3488726.1 DNA-deoxyinosine glycosylase [Gammaproteobacteria bacterium]MBT3717977.1 DNA-deoxyinosine glycosylase [Gammaproteobacteria bacterium]MBT3845429.1 DNA-deoxyinosine glycosylase [Gammaproteobacteria bacterium]MBT3893936.1 DNA-deoxyinosine glycosylase [Gammaproteobacteria bacterium]
MNFDQVEGFPPIEQNDVQILILGSAPSVESLKQQQYYAHPRNSFWPIITTLLTGESQQLSYPERTELLKQHQVALWDVMKSCERPGSLDSAITAESIEANNFEQFFSNHPQINALFFNGSKAEETYRKQVLPNLPSLYTAIPQHRLPSTSPAMAMLNREQKLEQWRVILEYVYIHPPRK